MNSFLPIIKKKRETLCFALTVPKSNAILSVGCSTVKVILGILNKTEVSANRGLAR